MSLFSFKIVDTIAKNGSFAKAADALHMTPSAVSHAVNKLEHEFKLQLFVRNRHGASLTRDGERLLPYIRTILQYHELLHLEVAQIHGSITGSVRLGTFNSVTVSWLPRLLKTFRSQYPEIDISIHQGSYMDIAAWLENDEIDLAFVINHTAPKNVDVIPLHQDPLVCITPPDYTPPNLSYVTPKDISRMNLILQHDGYNAEILDFLAQHHIKVKASFHIETTAAMVALVSSGFGFGIVSKMDSFTPISDVHIYPIHPPAFRVVSLACVQHSFPAPATVTLRNMILDYTQQTNIQNIPERP